MRFREGTWVNFFGNTKSLDFSKHTPGPETKKSPTDPVGYNKKPNTKGKCQEILSTESPDKTTEGILHYVQVKSGLNVKIEVS